jgi:hypothetical protein
VVYATVGLKKLEKQRTTKKNSKYVIILPNIIIELPLIMHFPSEIRIKPSKIAMKLNATSEPPQKEGLSPLLLSNQGEERGGGEKGG